jgi:hypothetical protein
VRGTAATKCGRTLSNVQHLGYKLQGTAVDTRETRWLAFIETSRTYHHAPCHPLGHCAMEGLSDSGVVHAVSRRATPSAHVT